MDMIDTILLSLFEACTLAASHADKWPDSIDATDDWLDMMTDGIQQVTYAALTAGAITTAERIELVRMLNECRDMANEAYYRNLRVGTA